MLTIKFQSPPCSKIHFNYFRLFVNLETKIMMRRIKKIGLDPKFFKYKKKGLDF